MATDKQISFLLHLLQKAGDSAIDIGKLKELDKDEAGELIDELLDTADVLDAGDWTPLHFAARNNEILVISTLVKVGADPNARDGRGRTPCTLRQGMTISRWFRLWSRRDSIRMRGTRRARHPYTSQYL